MYKKIVVSLVLILSLWSISSAQSPRSIRINEILVINDDNYVDSYGHKSPWVELFNSSAATVDIKGCYLTNDLNNPKLYMVPKGDVLTKIAPRQHTLFWIDNAPGRGTFHVNFTFDPDKENFIALFDSDGKTLIDSITIPKGQISDLSYGLFMDGVRGNRGLLNHVTPSTNNVTLDSNENIERFRENDGSGIVMSLTAISVVFIALVLLYLAFKLIGKLQIKRSQKKAVEVGGVLTTSIGQTSGEIIAAISTAIFELKNSLHDEESNIVTINKVKRNYSPWSSKIYSMTTGNPRNK